MTDWKDVLCLLTILMAYGLVGHLDYQDAVAMEEAMREDTPQPCFASLNVPTERALSIAADALPPRIAATTAVSNPACEPDNE